MHGQILAFEDRAAGRRGVLAKNDPVTPQRDPLVDATSVGFPLQLVLTIAGLLVAVMIGYFTGQSQWKSEMAGLRSDVRDGFTMILGDRKADGIRMDVIRRDLDEAMRLNKLQDIKIAEDHDALILLKGTR
mgnify:CR=1 FL=1